MNLNDLRATAYTSASQNSGSVNQQHIRPTSPAPSVSASASPARPAANQPASEASPAQNAANALLSRGLMKVAPEPAHTDGKDSVYRRVAKFLLLIGVDEAAKIIPHLTETQTERIIPEIASIRSVSPEEAEVILAEFRTLLERSRESGGVDTARTILEKAYGPERAKAMLEKAAPFAGSKPFDYLNDAASDRIFALLDGESPAIRALVLSRIEPKQAAAVINLMEPGDKKDIITRLAKMQPVAPDMLRRVDQAMHEKSLAQTSEQAEHIDGRGALAEILKKMTPAAENSILSALENDDPELGEDLRGMLFTLDDVVNADNRFIQEKLRQMTDIDIAMLVAGKPDPFRDKILSCISAGRRVHVRYEGDAAAPLLKKDCLRVTDSFMSALRRAHETGQLTVYDGRDEYV